MQTIALQVLSLAWVGKVAIFPLAVLLCALLRHTILLHTILWGALVKTILLWVGRAWATVALRGAARVVRGAAWIM